MGETDADEAAQALLQAPLRVDRLRCGAVRVSKAGMVGVGATLVDAARDWGSKFAVAVMVPRGLRTEWRQPSEQPARAQSRTRATAPESAVRAA